MKITKNFNESKHTIDGVGFEKIGGDLYAHIIIDGYISKRLKMGYRHERTWDDHMGNTWCGYFFNLVLNGVKRRIYADEVRLFG